MRAFVGFCPLVAPLSWFGGFSGAVLIWAVLSLPSFVLGLVFCFLSGVASLCLWFCRVGVSACAFAGVFLWLSCSFQWVVGPLCVCLVFWLLSAPLPAGCCFPSPCGWSRVAPWPSLYAGPSLWVSGCFCGGLVALPYCWECGCALSSLLHVVSWQQRPLALCGVCFTLYTMLHVLFGCSVLPR